MNCSIEECERSVIARGWCSLHYYRWRRNGDPLVLKPRESRIPDGCYGSDKVCEIAGVTSRQLNHWISSGYIPGQGELGTGLTRVWTREQLERVKEIRQAFTQVHSILAKYGLRSRWGRFA